MLLIRKKGIVIDSLWWKT